MLGGNDDMGGPTWGDALSDSLNLSKRSSVRKAFSVAVRRCAPGIVRGSNARIYHGLRLIIVIDVVGTSLLSMSVV